MSRVKDPVQFAINALSEIGVLVEEIETGEITSGEGLTMISDLAKNVADVLRGDLPVEVVEEM